MASQRGLWQSLKGSVSFAKSLLLDEIEDEIDVATPLGRGVLACQIRRSRKSSTQYLVIKTQGGDSTVFVPLDEKAAEEVVHFIEQSFLQRAPKTVE
jgi:hypothetical protein